MSKPKPDAWYAAIIERHVPRRPYPRDLSVAFVSGGLLCAAAELAHFFLTRQGMSAETASAWVTWARPISSPSEVAKELSAMFWALKGATLRPSWRNTRQRPAAMRLLPALDMVP